MPLRHFLVLLSAKVRFPFPFTACARSHTRAPRELHRE
jgi:hypothetical protein